MIVSNEYVKKGLTNAGKYLHAPEQRLLLGATALAIQPFIDLNNKEVDKETRWMSVARTTAKIIAGTAVGVAVRYAGIAVVKALSKYKPVMDDLGQEVIGLKDCGPLIPLFKGKDKFKPISPELLDANMNRYIKAMGTFFATIAMIYTNFSLDAPITKWLTSAFSKSIEKHQAKAKSESGVK